MPATMEVETRCPKCKGTGNAANGGKCSNCSGHGTIKKTTRVIVNVKTK